MMDPKKWYLSKTVWVNLISLMSIFLSNSVGVQPSAEESIAILAVVNLILRVVTKGPVTW